MYIREAHPSDAWQTAANLRERVVLATPRSLGEKREVAGACVRKLGIRIPALIDDVADSVEAAYSGWPDRLYLIDHEGRVAYKSAPGPYGFKPAALAQALAKSR